MKLATLSALTLGTIWALAFHGGAEDGDAILRAPEEKPPVLVELFTSEGCSSCPPADELLARLEKSQPVSGAFVIGLSEHVDYWNRLGWKDPYSSSLFSERQGAYAAAFRKSGVYTPQIVVDGEAELVGSDARAAERAIANAARRGKLKVEVSRERAGSTVMVRVGSAASSAKGEQSETLLAIVEDDLHSQVSRGENVGRRLSHTSVVRRLERIGSVEAGKPFERRIPLNLDPGWKRANLRAVVFVQERVSRKVLGVAQGAL